jgi:predicted ATP pyrophosphatase (TIGR00289 family)
MFRVCVLFSGGKDSTLASFWAMFQGFDVVLLTIKSDEDSWMFHRPNVEWAWMQAKAMELPHILVEGTKENELDIIKKTLEEMHFDGVVSGAIASEYQRQRIEQIAQELGIPSFSPLWHKERILSQVIKRMDVRLVSVAAEGFGKEHLFAKFPLALPKGCHAMLEGGEGETFVLDAPFFNKRIVVDEVEKQWDGLRGVVWIKKAHLEEK